MDRLYFQTSVLKNEKTAYPSGQALCVTLPVIADYFLVVWGLGAIYFHQGDGEGDKSLSSCTADWGFVGH